MNFRLYTIILFLSMARNLDISLCAALTGCNSDDKAGLGQLDCLGCPPSYDVLSFPLSLLTPGCNRTCLPFELLATATSLGSGTAFSDSAMNFVLDTLQPRSLSQPEKRSATKTSRRNDEDNVPADTRPTPEPTGDPSPSTTVHITSADDFALLMPSRQGELVSDAESDGVSYCTPSSEDSACNKRMQEGFIAAAVVEHADDGSWVQVTGCLDISKSILDPSDDGGQLDVRFPNGAQCSFGGYGASFIELVEPALSRFCLRCCAESNDQTHCNSHQDRLGCTQAVPGQYQFPELGVDCS